MEKQSNHGGRVIGLEDYEDYKDHVGHAYNIDDFKDDDCRPVPYDCVRMPDTMPTIYATGKLQKAVEADRCIDDAECNLISIAITGLRSLKQAWSTLADAFMLRTSVIESKPDIITSGKSGLVNNKIKALLDTCTTTQNAYKDNIYFTGFESDISKASSLMATVDSKDIKKAKRDSKKAFERIAKTIVSLQLSLMVKMKDRKRQLLDHLQGDISKAKLADLNTMISDDIHDAFDPYSN